MGFAEAISQKKQIDTARDLAREQVSREFVADIARLTADIAHLKEMLVEGHDLLNAVMMRSGMIFKLAEHGEVIAKVKAWNLRVRNAGIIKIVSGVAG